MTLFKISWKIIKWTESNLQYYWNILQRACIMQHASLTSLTYLGSCKTCFFCIPVFGRKGFLIFPIIDLTVDLKLICIIGLSDWVNSLIFADSCPGGHNYSIWGLLSSFTVYWSVGSEISLSKDVFWNLQCLRHYTLHWNYLISHAKTSLFVNCAGGSQGVQAKYEQLDTGEYGAVGTLAFSAEACALANLLACVSQLCQKLNLPPPKELYQLVFFKHWRCFLVLNYRQAVWLGYGGCSFVCRYLRITGLLSTPLVLRNGDWLCVLPAITLIVDKSKKVNKAVYRVQYIVFDTFDTFDMSKMSNITLFTVLYKSCKHHLWCLWLTQQLMHWNLYCISLIPLTLLWSFVCIQCYVCYVSQHLQYQTICIDTHPLMYTQLIRWQWVWMSGFLTI